MDFDGFKQFSKAEILSWKTWNKEDLAKMAIPEDVTFDYALPHDWLMDFSNWAALRSTDYAYHFILGTTFMLYSDERGFRYGVPWSACDEINTLIELHQRKDEL